MTGIEITTVDPADQRAVRAIEAYFAEVASTLEGGFELGPEDLVPFRPPGGVFLLATDPVGEVVGCVAVRTLEPGTGEVKRMWIDPRTRGEGLGRQLLAAAEREALRLGALRIRLDTNATLRPAIALYRSAGYVEIDRYNDNPHAEHWFEKDARPLRS